MRRHSPSSVARYARCPRRYYWRHVVRVPRRLTPAQQLGINLHAALERFERAGGIRTGGVAEALACLEATWQADGFADAAAEQAAFKDAVRRLEAHMAEVRLHPAGEPLLLEARIEGTLGEMAVVGVVDRLDRTPEGSLVLIDYKSTQRAGEAEGPETVRQMAVYRELVRQHLGRAPDRVTIVQPGVSSQDLTWGEAQWAAALEDVVRTMRAIEADEAFEARVGPGCEACEYARRCVPWRLARDEAASG